MRRRRHHLLAAGFCCAVATVSPPASADDFYKGRTFTLVVGHEAGSGYDVYSRVVARHLGRHIPGNPNVVVQNMVGASGMIAANWLYNVAPKDGTVMATFVRIADLRADLRQPAARFAPAQVHLDRQHGRGRRHLRRDQRPRASHASRICCARRPCSAPPRRPDRSASMRWRSRTCSAPRSSSCPGYKGSAERQARDQSRRGARHLRAVVLDRHLALARRLRIRELQR